MPSKAPRVLITADLLIVPLLLLAWLPKIPLKHVLGTNQAAVRGPPRTRLHIDPLPMDIARGGRRAGHHIPHIDVAPSK